MSERAVIIKYRTFTPEEIEALAEAAKAARVSMLELGEAMVLLSNQTRPPALAVSAHDSMTLFLGEKKSRRRGQRRFQDRIHGKGRRG
jgi:hypothetical protein